MRSKLYSNRPEVTEHLSIGDTKPVRLCLDNGIQIHGIFARLDLIGQWLLCYDGVEETAWQYN